MAWAAAVAAGLQAVSSIQQGRYQKAMYNIQAKQAELQGRQKALNYSRQALDVLESQRRIAGGLVARSAAGGIDPFSGSPMTVDQWNAYQAGDEYNLGIENADMAIAGGLAQSQSLQAAGKQAMKTAYMNAAMSVAQGAYMYNTLSTPGGAGGLGGSMVDPSSVGAAQGYGVGSVGYGAGYGINPFGEQARMLSAQW
jgi:hypothetical protein